MTDPNLKLKMNVIDASAEDAAKEADLQAAALPSQEVPLIPIKKRAKKKGDPEPQYPEEFAGVERPLSLWRNKRIGERVYPDKWSKIERTGKLHLAGRGAKAAQVMFVGPCVLNEEEGGRYTSSAGMLNGAPGNLFMRSLSRGGFQDHEWFYTTLVKYNVERLKPKTPDIRWCESILDDELKTIQPKIVVCMGKEVFDYMWTKSTGKVRRFALRDVQGGFFQCPTYDCVLYPMDPILLPLLRPEYLERFMVDLKSVRECLDEIQGVSRRIHVEQKYVTIEKAEVLANVIARMKVAKVPFVAVDAEWHGQTWVGGNLRSFQWSWAPGHAAYLKLMNQKQVYCFDKPMEVVQNIIGFGFNDPSVRFIGHNASADMPWMKERLKINVYRRFWFDTMYAQHTCNEYADLKLERLAVQFTDLGRYDIALTLWKKENKFDEKNEPGYGRVPDRILIPYGLRDVDTTFRCVPFLMKRLIDLGLLKYYREFILPFVTDGFHEMMDVGLPVNQATLDDLREVFTRNELLLTDGFRNAIDLEASTKLQNVFEDCLPANSAKDAFIDFYNVIKRSRVAGKRVDLSSAEVIDAIGQFKEMVGVDRMAKYYPVLEHFLEARVFNINSTDQIKRWLFDVKGKVPLKTTKKDGIQISWERVLTYEKIKQAEYQPAADKQTIKVYADQDALVSQLQELKSVGNIVKAFLKGPDEEGREQGIPKWIQPDGRIHANFSLTETARPRTWKPNILNWPKSITKPIEAAFSRIQKAHPAHAEKPATLRSVIEAPPGWGIVDMDLKTAEVVALAYQAGDENMIKVLTEPDLQFARVDKDNPKKVERICYNENSCYPDSERDSSVLISSDDPRILKRDDGSIVYPKRDLHWEMAESVASKPREKLDERLYRDGCGKVGNFSIPYGATATLLERLIEVNTAKKPLPGTGDKMIEAYCTRYPQANEFLQYMERQVEAPGWWRSLSGRVRHFFFSHVSEIRDFEDFRVKGMLSDLGRQARNFPMQELVAATTGKALLRFIEERRKMKLDSRIAILLYDAMTALTPLEQIKETTELLKNCLTVWCPWTVKGRTFNFEVDITYAFRWGAKMTPEEKVKLAPYLK